MQSQSNMPNMQFNPFTQFIRPERGFTLRTGQEEALTVATTTKKDSITGLFPTGYGKTVIALGSYGVLRERGAVDRLLILVPTDQQREQFTDKSTSLCRKLGFTISGALTVRKVPADLRYHWENGAEIFVASYQQVSRGDTFFAELMATGKWMIFKDEVHHLVEEKAWGRAVSQLTPVFTLNLTATPIRTDKKAVYGLPIKEMEDGSVEVVPDVMRTLKQAIDEKACRKPHGIIQHYHVDVQIDGSDEIIRVDTEYLKQEGITDFDSFETRRGLRYCNKYLSRMLLDAVACYERKNLSHPGEHQMLVFAMTCNHAEAITKQINSLVGEPFADWIGVLRPHRENTEILDKYTRGNLPCLVQVQKAGEGFDNQRCSILVFLHLIKAESKLIQQIGRGLRRNENIKDFDEDVCDIFASADSPIGEYVANLSMELGIDKKKKGSDGSGEGGGDDLFSIPDLKVVDAEFIRSQLVTPSLPTTSNERQKLLLTWASMAGLPENTPIESIERLLELASGITQNKPESRPAFESESSRIAHYQDQVKRATSMLASNVVKIRSNGSFEKSLLGDTKRTINAQWKRISGFGHDAMTADEYLRKHEWLKQINQDIKESREVPSWLML